MSGLVWEEPPPKKGGHGKYETLLTELRTRPREWARMETFRSSTAYSVRSRLSARYGQAYEFAVRNTDGSKHNGSTLYGRYIGNGSES